MQKEYKVKLINQNIRKQRTRKKIRMHSEFPRLSVYRSLKHFYAQIIDDNAGQTLCSACDQEIKAKGIKPVEMAAKVGAALAAKALEKKIKQVVFDRGAYRYHGAIKACAEACREAGLKI